MRRQTRILAALATAGLLLAACAPGPTTGSSAVADGVKFNYALAPTEKPGTYHLTLALADAANGTPITNANVALDLFGPGYPGGTLINLKRGVGADGAAAAPGAAPPPTYGVDVALPEAASYRMTFKVNRAAAGSAEAAFTAHRPAAG